jgi:hypothetical protein
MARRYGEGKPMKVLMRALGAGAAAVALAVVPTEAMAAGNSVYYAWSLDGTSTYAKFESNGELFSVCDNKSDGHHAVGYYNLPDSGSPRVYYPVHYYGGAGGCKLVNLSLAEGDRFVFQSCIGEGSEDEGDVWNCGPYKTGTA